MEVLIAGGHGKIALHLERMLAERGDRARGIIRNPAHAAELERIGAALAPGGQALLLGQGKLAHEWVLARRLPNVSALADRVGYHLYRMGPAVGRR